MTRLPRSAAPAPSPLSQAVHQHVTGRTIGAPGQDQKGFSLIEMMLGLAAISVMGVGTYAVYESSRNNADVRTEQDNIQQIVRKVDGAYGATGSFASLTTTSAIAAKAVPSNLIQGASLRNAWGSSVDLAPTNVDGKTNAGMQITYQSVPEKACAKLGTSVSDGMWDILVNGTSVMDNHELDTANLVTRCAAPGGAEMIFKFYGGSTGLAVTAPATLCGSDPTNPLCVAVAPPSASPPPVATPPFTPPAPPPATPPATPPPSVAPPVATPIVAPPPPPPPPAFAPPPPPSSPGFCPPVAAATPPKAARDCSLFTAAATCEDGAAATDGSGSYSCPAGQLISSPGPSLYAASGPQSRTRNENHSWACTDPWNDNPISFADVWTSGAWNPWGPTYTCAPTCVAPATLNTPYSQTASCLAGRVTPAGASTFTQNRTGTITYSCSTPISPVAAAPETYTAWSPTEAAACATACVAPASVLQSQAGAPQFQSPACPAGMTGTWNQTRTTTQTRTITYSCPAPTGAYTTTTPAWGAPGPAYGAWTNTAYTCAPNCVAPAPSSVAITRAAANENQNVGCPATWTGAHWQTRSRVENGTRTTSYFCPAPTGAYAANPATDSWSGTFTATSGWSTTSNTCTAPPVCGPAPAPGSRTVACVAPQTGPGYTQTHGWNAVAAPTCWQAQAWATTGGSCTTPPPPPAGCAIQYEYWSGVMDTTDAFFNITYSVNGVGGGCMSSRRDHGPSGSSTCSVGNNGLLDLSAWAAVAVDGDTYLEEGSQSGWSGSGGEFWGWDHIQWYRASGAACP